MRPEAGKTICIVGRNAIRYHEADKTEEVEQKEKYSYMVGLDDIEEGRDDNHDKIEYSLHTLKGLKAATHQENLTK